MFKTRKLGIVNCSKWMILMRASWGLNILDTRCVFTQWFEHAIVCRVSYLCRHIRWWLTAIHCVHCACHFIPYLTKLHCFQWNHIEWHIHVKYKFRQKLHLSFFVQLTCSYIYNFMYMLYIYICFIIIDYLIADTITLLHRQWTISSSLSHFIHPLGLSPSLGNFTVDLSPALRITYFVYRH
jgi:hypothetical protein